MLVVTADHGQVEVGTRVEVLGPELMDDVVFLSGEGRFRWLHVRPGATDDVAAAASEAFGHLAWVRTRQAVIDEGWLGGEPVPEVADRLGDVALLPPRADRLPGPGRHRRAAPVARHGSLTTAEMHVPLLAWPTGGRRASGIIGAHEHRADRPRPTEPPLAPDVVDGRAGARPPGGRRAVPGRSRRGARAGATAGPRPRPRAASSRSSSRPR